MNPSEEKAKAPEKTKALCVATRCTSVEQFVATFHRFCDESSFFVATLATRPVGLETAFSIQLEDKTPVLRGLCVVVEAWSTPANRFGRPGVRLSVRRLTNESLAVFKQLQAARIAAEAAEKAKPVEAAPPKLDAVPPAVRVDAAPAAPIDTARPEDAAARPKPVETPKPEKPKSLSEKLAEIKSQPKPPAIPPRKTDGIPPIPSSVPSIPKINPTAFAVKPARANAPSIIVEVEIDEPAKIEAKSVRAEGTAPVTRADEPTATGPAPASASISSAPSANAPVANTVPASAPITSAPVAAAPVGSSTVTSATSAPIDAPSRPTPHPRAVNATTPAIGISTSTINLSNAALTAEDTHAQAASYPDVASIVDTPPKAESAIETKPASAEYDPRESAPEAIAASDDMTSPIASESRAPGSSFVLPANPLMNLSDKSLEGFVDCALYEETGNFFRAPGYEDSLVDIDEVAPPPGILAPTPAIRPGDEVSQAAYVITPTPATPFPPELTPVPVTGRNPTQPPYPAGQIVPVQLPSGQIVSMQYPQYPTGHLPYPTHSGTTNPPYAVMHAPPQESTAALLAMSAPNRRRWMIIGGVAVFASLVLLVLVIATRGEDKTATAATTPQTTTTEKKQPSGEKVTMAVTAPVETTVTSPTPPTPVTPAKAPATMDEEAATGDPNSPPVVGSGPCKLTVTTTPAGSIVRLDDQVMGPSPITIQGACARRRVDAKHPRYAPGTKWVNLAADKPASVDIPLSRPTHRITVISQPAGATVSIAGKRAGTTPTAVQMMGFTRVALTIEKKGYQTVVESVYSKSDGERRTVTLTRVK
ncbi:MAG: PEGA domain-containing protein [Kofleriaceae bacterium]